MEYCPLMAYVRYWEHPFDGQFTLLQRCMTIFVILTNRVLTLSCFVVF